MTETTWIHRLFILVPADEAAIANAGHTLYWPGRDAERSTFTVPLSSDGARPATHYGCNTAATESLRQTWLAMQDQGVGSGATWHRLGVDANILLETNSLDAEIGQLFDWQDALADNSLQLIEEVS